MTVLALEVLPERLSVVRLEPAAAVPAWAASGPLQCAVRTVDELSVIAVSAAVPTGLRAEGPFRALKVRGPLDFSATGILASLALPLAEARVSIFALSTFDTDYVLVRAEALEPALHALRTAGHEILEP